MPLEAVHPTIDELEQGVDHVRRSPREVGRLDLIVRRPAFDEREAMATAELDVSSGLAGDTWSSRPSSRTPDGSPHPDMQLNIMNSRAAALVAGPVERWQLAGDQLYVDLDLSDETLPPGTRLGIGSAIIEVTDQPHRGCAKFGERFGMDATRFVNSPAGRELRLRGINAKVVVSGMITVGDDVRILAADS